MQVRFGGLIDKIEFRYRDKIEFRYRDKIEFRYRDGTRAAHGINGGDARPPLIFRPGEKLFKI